jgi:hypothetical protein
VSNRWGGGGAGGGGSGTIKKITSATLAVTDPTGPTTNLEDGIVAIQTITGTTGFAYLYEYVNVAGISYTLLAFESYTNTNPETITFDNTFVDGNVGFTSWGSSPALTLSLTQIGIPAIASSLTGIFAVLGF